MLTVHDYERIRQAYYVEKKSIRQIGRETGHGYWTVRKALESGAAVIWVRISVEA